MKNLKGILWGLSIVLIFLLSQDYVFIDWSLGTHILGFPSWLFWFMGVHALFILVFYFFTQKYWKE